MFKVLDEKCHPQRATKYSAYVDLFASEDVVIGAGQTKIVPLGVKIDFNDEMTRKMEVGIGPYGLETFEERVETFKLTHYLEIALRNSTAVKGLVIANGTGKVDLDCPDEIGIIVHNPHSSKTIWDIVNLAFVRFNGGDPSRYQFDEGVLIKQGDKVAQCTLIEHKGYLMGYESTEERTGGYGSTGESKWY
jgi:dUTPase